MKRYAVDLPDVEKQAGPPNQGADLSWELGATKNKGPPQLAALRFGQFGRVVKTPGPRHNATPPNEKQRRPQYAGTGRFSFGIL